MLEKQLTGHRVDRSICDWFWNQAISQGDSFKVPKWLFRYILVHFGTFEILGLISNLLIIPTCYVVNFTFSLMFLSIATTGYCFTNALSLPNSS